jgi:hypothetical protein
MNMNAAAAACTSKDNKASKMSLLRNVPNAGKKSKGWSAVEAVLL